MVTGLPLPLGLDGAVTAVGNCNTAMSMMVIGMILADIDLKDFWDWTVVKYTVHRLVVIPVVVYIICSFLPLNKTVLGLCVLLAAMPAGATTSILAEKYQVDSPFATKMVIFSTLLSLPTICLWSIFLQQEKQKRICNNAQSSIYGYAKIEQKGEAGGNLKPEKYAG